MVWLLPYVLAALGVGFLIANVRAFADIVRYRRKRKSALLIWPGPPPPFYGLVLFLGVALGILIFVKLIVLHRLLEAEQRLPGASRGPTRCNRRSPHALYPMTGPRRLWAAPVRLPGMGAAWFLWCRRQRARPGQRPTREPDARVATDGGSRALRGRPLGPPFRR